MINLLGYRIYNDGKECFFNYLRTMLNSGSKYIILSGNPEVLFNIYNNRSLYKFYTKPTVVTIPDGIGTVYAGKINKIAIKEKIAGIDVANFLLSNSKEEKIKIYLLGAKKSIVKKAYNNCLAQNYNVVGYHDGYFDINNCSEVLVEINKSKADVLFVAMGCPIQELFIQKYFNLLDCKLFMGVGGTFDVLSGSINRAPDIMIKFKLEWLYRIFKQPSRIFRLKYVIDFIKLVKNIESK